MLADDHPKQPKDRSEARKIAKLEKENMVLREKFLQQNNQSFYRKFVGTCASLTKYLFIAFFVAGFLGYLQSEGESAPELKTQNQKEHTFSNYFPMEIDWADIQVTM